MALVAVVLAAALVAVLLSFDSIAQLFKQRASFDQSYDEGRFGRFGRHILGAEMALDLPFGIGPLQFNRFFPEDTHNSYLNAFMSGGWLSGVCYPALVFVTVMTGFRYVFVRVPWQPTYLAIFSAFLGTVGESFIIDTDHWRHFWLMLGAMWGMFAAAERWKAGTIPRSRAREGFLASWIGRVPCGFCAAFLGRIDHRLELFGRRQHGLVALRRRTPAAAAVRRRNSFQSLHRALHVLVELPDLGDVLRDGRDKDLAAIVSSRSRRTRPAFSSRSTTPVMAPVVSPVTSASRPAVTRPSRLRKSRHSRSEPEIPATLATVCPKITPCADDRRSASPSSCISAARAFALDKARLYILVDIYLSY